MCPLFCGQYFIDTKDYSVIIYLTMEFRFYKRCHLLLLEKSRKQNVTGNTVRARANAFCLKKPSRFQKGRKATGLRLSRDRQGHPTDLFFGIFSLLYGFHEGFEHVLGWGFGLAGIYVIGEAFLFAAALRRARRTGILNKLSE